VACRIANGDAKPQIAEVAFAHEMAARNGQFATTADPSRLLGKSVTWFLPRGLISPPLWNYGRLVHDFAKGLEEQGNPFFCSADEVVLRPRSRVGDTALKAAGPPRFGVKAIKRT
jgi:hypothetical protein